MKKIKEKILKEFDVFIMKFLTEHNKQVILEIINYSVLTTCFLFAPTVRQAVDLVFCTLAIFRKFFFTETDVG